MKQSFLEFYDDLDKARDRALWLEFEYRTLSKHFIVFDGPQDNYAVADLQTAEELDVSCHHYSLPENYEHLSYTELKKMGQDTDLLSHWESLLGTFSVMEGELLRFIIACKIPLEKIIRHELGNRGFDHNSEWIGFKASEKLWNKEDDNL